MSNTIVLILCAFSKASLFFINIPFLLATPDDTTIASGVAKPKLHGHATTKIETKTLSAVPKSLEIISHDINETIAIIITTGTKYPLILSAIFAIGAFVLVASTTSLTISETVDSFPIFCASYLIVPSKFILPAITFEPFSLLTGMLSPVIKDSFICVIPSTIIPSTAIFSPGLQITISPFFIYFIVIMYSFLSFLSTSFLGLFVI